MSTEKPKSITGGCNCGGVRYRVDFATDHDWKRAPNTCQCTQCRKMSGSLIFHFHTVKNTEITWLSKSTYAEYNSSADFFRAFCNKCGCSIAWINFGVGTEIELAAGSIDEEFLVGNRDADDKPLGAYGIPLANLEGEHLYVRNEIVGVTDAHTVHGTRFWKGTQNTAQA
ncbi:Mss4-like protein [Mycena albidolilacea]|uniref:Mss4-like protein n=1 Tax=Mycena albidolilacea TaxID=1033008 RepID=A0AAD7ACM8_9AGAR|nr:Mss4-like protein [Mycena albidolilacea]